MDVGERPADLKPSLKKTDCSASSTSKMAKKVHFKLLFLPAHRSDQEKVFEGTEDQFSQYVPSRLNHSVAWLGWSHVLFFLPIHFFQNPYAIRMDEDDENLTAVSRLPKPREHRLIKNLKITPLSLQKVRLWRISH